MKKKSVIAVLTVWSFVNLVLLMFGDYRYSNFTSFFPFTYEERTHITSKISAYRTFEEVSTVKVTEYFSVEDYDFIEFIAYVGGAWLIFLLCYYLKKKLALAVSIFWSFMHLVLLMLGSLTFSIDPKREFFPFVDTNIHEISFSKDIYSTQYFYYYDLTEFTVYVGGAWLITFLHYYLTKQKNE
jgi:hypothetical protein